MEWIASMKRPKLISEVSSVNEWMIRDVVEPEMRTLSHYQRILERSSLRNYRPS